MSSVEPARHALYSALEDVLGSEHADTLMTHLPQDRSEEVATKADLGAMDGRSGARFDQIGARFDQMEVRFHRMEERMEARFDRMEGRMDRMQRFYVATTVGSMTALTAIFSLVVSFLG